MNQPIVVTIVFALAMILLCIRNPHAGRIMFSFFFLAMAMVNIYLITVDVSIYVNYGKEAFWEPYRWFFREIVSMNPGLWVLLLIIFQLTIALLMLGNNHNTRLGLMGAIIFVLTITPLSIETLGNLGIAAAMIILLRPVSYESVFKTLGKSLN